MVDLEQRMNRERRDGPSLVYRSRLADWRSCDRYRCYAKSVSNTSGRPTCAPGFPDLVKGFLTFYWLKVDSDLQPSVSFSMVQNPHVSHLNCCHDVIARLYVWLRYSRTPFGFNGGPELISDKTNQGNLALLLLSSVKRWRADRR